MRLLNRRPALSGLAALLLSSAALTGCTPVNENIPPAPSVTGSWQGDISHWALGSYKVTAALTQTDNPRAGDFTGTVSSSDIGLRGNVTGNVRDGTLVASDGATTVTCSGTFTVNAKYAGSCSVSGQTAQLLLYLQRP